MSVISITLKGIDEASGVISGVAGGLSSLGDVAGGILSAGLAVGAAGFTALAAGAGFALSAAMDNEQAQASLAQVIKATGGAAGVTAEEANAMAEEFAHLAGGSDDAILAIETIGLRAGTVAEEDFPRFIQASLDLGTVMGSTEAAATLLARAGDDIGAAIGKAEKAGILFTDEQKAQMIAMQDAGDSAGALDLFMQRLAETTGGAAAAQAETLAGKIETLKGQFGEAAEGIGMALLPIATELFDNVIAPAIPIVQDLATKLSEMITGFISNAGGFQGMVAGIQEKLTSLQPIFQPIIDAATNLANAFIASMPMIQGTVQTMVDFVIGQFNTLSPTIIANVSSTLNSIAAFWTEHGDTIMAVVTLAFEFITVTIGVAMTTISGLIAAGMALINGDTSGALEILQSTFTTIMDSILSIVGTDLETFVSDWQGTFAMVDDIVNIGIASILTMISGGLNEAVTTAQTIVAGFVAIGEGIINGISDGITNTVAGLINQVTGIANDIAQAIRDALGQHSPSTVGIAIGQNFIRSVGIGGVEAARETQRMLSGSVSNIAYNLTINSATAPVIPAEFGRAKALSGAF